MPKTPRPHKFQVCLSEQECSMLEEIAQRENMTRSELLRFKTIYQKLPRRTTKIAAQTYWLLANQTKEAVRSRIDWKYALSLELTDPGFDFTTIGHDGMQLLKVLWEQEEVHYLRQLPAVEILRLTWIHQYYVKKEQVRLRATADLPPTSSANCWYD
jgi:hypothetical protein